MRRLVPCLAAAFVLSVAVAQASHRSDGSTPAPVTITHLVTHVPARTLDRVGAGKVLGQNEFTVTKLSGAPLTKGGKPELLTFVLAWCPHCAADSWGLAIALSRFGKLSALRTIDSGTLYGTKFHGSPAFAHTQGLSFFGARYTSAYLRFVSVVLQDVAAHNLQSPTRAEGQTINGFDRQGNIPVVDAGGAYGFVGSAFSPGVLARKSSSQIAASLANPNSPIAQHIDGLANLFAAAICKATNQTPAAVCNSAGVLAAGAARLH
jgi:Domain of unknown function (DUF929)